MKKRCLHRIFLLSIRFKLPKMETATNVVRNAVAPLDFGEDNRVLGTAEYVAIEVAVSKIVRSVLKMENRSVWDLFWIHLLSVPFLGGLGAPFGDQTPLANTNDYTQALKDGARGIPAVLAAQWVYNTASRGFHVPWFGMKDLLITAGSKAITRPLTYSVRDKLPGGTAALAVIDALIQRQAEGSNIRPKA